MKKKRNSSLILAERHVKCESVLLAHVESSGTNSLVYREVLSAVILPRLFHLCDSTEDEDGDLQLCNCVLLKGLLSVLISLYDWQNGSKIYYLK